MTDLDTALRDMLRTRASDIDAVPASLLTTPDTPAAGSEDVVELGSRSPRTTRWLAVAAAAVAVLIAGALTFVTGTGPDTTRPPADSTKPTVVRNACERDLPRSWAPAVRAATTSLGQDVTSGFPVASTRDGGLIVSFSTNPDPTVVDDQQLGYLAPGAAPVRSFGRFFSTSPSAAFRGGGTVVTTDADLAAVAVEGPDAERRTRPNEYPIAVDRLEVVHIATGRREVVARRADYPSGSLLSDAWVLRGVVYWTVDRSRQDTRVYGYDVATKRTQLVDSGPQLTITGGPAGISWHTSGVDRAAAVRLPAALTTGLNRVINPVSLGSAVSDGRAWAWLTPQGFLAWWSPTADRVVMLRGLTTAGTVGPIAVAGPLIAYFDPSGHEKLVDTRTGVSVPTDGSTLFGTAGLLAGSPLLTPGASYDVSALMRLEPSTLPRLHC